MIASILGLINGAVALFNRLLERARDNQLRAEGARAQENKALKASVEAAIHARKTENNVRCLSDDELNRELRGSAHRPE